MLDRITNSPIKDTEKLGRADLVELAESILRHTNETRYVDIDSFSGKPGYTPEMIATAKRRTQEARNTHEKATLDWLGSVEGKDQKSIVEGKEISDAFEATVLDQITPNAWLGMNAVATKITEHGDLCEHTDGVLEIMNSDETERFALSIDTSRNLDSFGIDKKVVRNLKTILGVDRPTRVTFFRSEIPNDDGSYYEGPLEGIIPLIIGTGKEKCDELIQHYGTIVKFTDLLKTAVKSADKERIKAKIAASSKKIAEHPAQMVFIRAIQIQLGMYANILQRIINDTKNPQPALNQTLDHVRQVTTIFDDILKEKLREGFDPEEADQDEFIQVLTSVRATNEKHY